MLNWSSMLIRWMDPFCKFDAIWCRCPKIGYMLSAKHVDVSAVIVEHHINLDVYKQSDKRWWSSAWILCLLENVPCFPHQSSHIALITSREATRNCHAHVCVYISIPTFRIKRFVFQANRNHPLANVSVSIFRNVTNVPTTHVDLSCYWFEAKRLHLRIHFSQSYAPSVFSSRSFWKMNISPDDVSSNPLWFSYSTLSLLRHICTVHDNNDTVRLQLTKYG